MSVKGATGRKSLVYANNTIINNLHVPLKCKITTPKYGEMIIIGGRVPDKTRRFSVNLDVNNGKSEETLFHASVRFDERITVRNSRLAGKWGQEDRFGGLGNIRQGQDFLCIIFIHPNHFKLAFNGEHLADFAHRRSPTTINQLHIEGTVELTSFLVQKAPQDAIQGRNTLSMPHLPETIEETLEGGATDKSIVYGNMTIPHHVYIEKGFTAGRWLYICAKAVPYAKRFQIDLKEGGPRGDRDVPLHFNIRFDENSLVVNNRERGKWKKEEIMAYHTPDKFPLKIGAHYDIVIFCKPDRYAISLNNSHLMEFRHRHQDLKSIKGLEISGDLKLIHVRMR